MEAQCIPNSMTFNISYDTNAFPNLRTDLFNQCVVISKEAAKKVDRPSMGGAKVLFGEPVYDGISRQSIPVVCTSFDKNDYMTEYCNKVYATKYSEAKELVEKYYNVMPSLDTKYLCNVYEKYFNYFYEEESPGIKNFVLKEGLILKKGMELIAEFERSSPADFEEKIYLELKSVLSEYLALSEKFTKLGEGSSRAARLHTEVKWTLHCITLSSIYRWYIHLYEARIQRSRGDRQESTESLQKACEALEKYIEVRKCAEYGEFKNWYREEIKFNIEKHLEYTKKLL
jgi:hypothetical protein